MPSPTKFEIRVAVIGPVSAGKSTLINALLVGKFNEVSIRRTTAGVNFFRLTQPPASPTAVTSAAVTSDPVTSDAVNTTSTESSDDSMLLEEFESQDEVRNEIMEDNTKLRELPHVTEKTFDLEGMELCECRDDTSLVIVDVPGINEADSSSKYRDYVADNWNSLDCVILVMDGRQGVNTEEQVHMLEFIKKNLDQKKHLPVMILFNKVDELDKREEGVLVDEARDKLLELFDIPKESNYAQDIAGGNPAFQPWDTKPIFLPISARNGYVYRLAPVVGKDRFKKLERDLVEALGKEQIGLRRWNKMGENKKYEAAYEAISDPEVYKEGLQSSNFDSFLSILKFCVGGKETQTRLIQEQASVCLRTLAPKRGMAQNVASAHAKMKEVGMPSAEAPVHEVFWKLFDVIEKNTEEGDCQSSEQALPIDELIRFHQLAVGEGWQEDQTMTIERSKAYLNRFVDRVLTRQRTARMSDVAATPTQQNTELQPEELEKQTVVARLRSHLCDLTEITQLLDMAVHEGVSPHFPFLRMVLQMEHGRAVSRVDQMTMTICGVCKQIVPKGANHFRHRDTCLKQGSQCPYTYDGQHNLAPIKDATVAGKFNCARCRSVHVDDSTERPTLVDHFTWTNDTWKARLWDGSNVVVSAREGVPSDSGHRGHGFWLFSEWMATAKKETACAEQVGSKRKRADGGGQTNKAKKAVVANADIPSEGVPGNSGEVVVID